MHEQRFDLGREQQLAAALRVKEGFDAQTVSREDQALLPRVPYRNGKVTVEMAGKVESPFLVGVRNYFGVRTFAKEYPDPANSAPTRGDCKSRR